jgi:hypothetical protein
MSIRIDRLMLIKALKITLTSSKQVITQQTLNPNASTTLLPSTIYKHAIILFHGDGDPEVKHMITVDGTTTELSGDQQAIELLAEQTIEVTATNTSATDLKKL